ncbi:esterase E4-like [Vanessa tameamea]|uniref:Esterase E4-like n=1 Tax=Vanessa tameamea TaxID=334116 RepID=A0A8B8IS35_VANTA
MLTGFLFLLLLLEIRTLNVKVNVKQGTLIGNREITVFGEKFYYAFYGVPYAQAPVGKLRFVDPKPVKKWTKPLDASTEYRGACAQAHIVHKQGQYGFENCLHLNIYTPNLPKYKKEPLKAVIVWIHGYAFASSFSHLHGPDFLIENDVLFITLTHRIGVFGFLKINETDSSANMGLKDIVLGLKWIKTNVDQFGGDSKNITVMGSGSASTFLSLLLTTKHRNIFSKMILQSGSIFSPSLYQVDRVLERNKLEKEIKKGGFKNLKSVPTNNIIQAYRKIYSSNDLINFQRPLIPFLPTIEKESNRSLLIKNANQLYKTIENIDIKIPILIGFTSQESITELIPFIHNPYYLKSFKSFFKYMVPFSTGCKYEYSTKTYRAISNEIKNQYFRRGISEHSIKDFLKFSSDLHKYPIYKFIKSRLNFGSKMYVYKFNYVGKFNLAKATALSGANIKIKGAAQGDEICYILKCDPQWESYVKLKNDSYDKDREFIKQISKMWANFAKTGDPTPLNSFSNYTWLPMSLKDDNVFLFDKVSRLTDSKPEQKMYTFWNELFDKYYASDKCKSFEDEL